jgi:hypothetical protein
VVLGRAFVQTPLSSVKFPVAPGSVPLVLNKPMKKLRFPLAVPDVKPPEAVIVKLTVCIAVAESGFVSGMGAIFPAMNVC